MKIINYFTYQKLYSLQVIYSCILMYVVVLYVASRIKKLWNNNYRLWFRISTGHSDPQENSLGQKRKPTLWTQSLKGILEDILIIGKINVQRGKIPFPFFYKPLPFEKRKQNKIHQSTESYCKSSIMFQ